MADIEAVFKAYDIRGRTDTGELDEELARDVGSAFATIAGGSPIAVGRDCRISSPSIAGALMQGVNEAGCDVMDLGEVATDVVYYVSGSRSVPGVMVTASHNPGEYNGIKLCRSGAAPVGSDSGLDTIKQMILQGRLITDGHGEVRPFDPLPGYIDHLCAIVDPDSIGPLRVVVDGGNGMAGVVLTRLFDRLPAELFGLFLEPDGTFPNHPADPLQPQNLVDLTAAVESRRPDLGVAFDGDADRAFFVDDTGAPLSGSTTTALIARWFLTREPGASIVHNLITSKAVPEIVSEAGGVPVRTRVGHSYIKQVMADTGAVFGGEHSGHYYFRDNYRADSGMLAMLVLLRVMTESGAPLSKLRLDVERYAASGEINIRVADNAAALAAVESAFAGEGIDRVDGITVDLGSSWFNLRPSNTEPYVRLNVEGPDSATVDSLTGRVRGIVLSS
ncbi:MAG TPA: phosphomannomutase/phosphoglucomutase [Acidimicrobiia bacterium]|nr:phosphomannomutase/phosphoglucomutase [Acidimicrobiia bacterium]